MRIGKISSVNFGEKDVYPPKNADYYCSDVLSSEQNSDEIMSKEGAQALRASVLFNKEKLQSNIIETKEVRVPDLFNLEEDIHLSVNELDEDHQELNAAGLNIARAEDDNKKYIEITNDEGDKIFKGEVEKGVVVPKVTYKQGKYMPEITVKDPVLHDSVVKMFAGSKIEGKGFKFVMPGEYKDMANGNTISFTGKTVITTYNHEPRTQNAVDLYMTSDLPKETIHGDYSDFVKENDPTIVIPAGGFGERFKNMTRNKENKPSYTLPTRDEYRIIATALNMAASMGIIDENEDNNDLTYISQNRQIEGDNVKYAQRYKTDGGAIAEGLDEDYIDKNKDMIILNGDIISNADMSRIYKAFKELPNAALVIPYHAVDPERAKAFGLLGFDESEDGNKYLTSFVEKTQYTNKIPKSGDFSSDEDYKKAMNEYINARKALNPDGSGTFFINPGIYVMSPEATKVLRHIGIKDPETTGLGKHVMPEIVRMCNEGKLVDKEGNQMKAYIVPLEAKGGKAAFWDDIGTAEAYLSTIKDIARETLEKESGENNYYYGMPEFVLKDFVKNVDFETGIVYMSDTSKNNARAFSGKYDAEIKGNIFIS